MAAFLLSAGIGAVAISPSPARADSSSSNARSADATQDLTQDLQQMSLEELMSLDVVEVSSVSKRTEKLFDAPAAATVISQKDIRESGLNSIAELLRLAPGISVARVSANTWTISGRGLNDMFSNKLLVLMDGRSVYSPVLSGTFWDQQDYILQDLDRIEVIRGPDGTLWGANAVNGVVNITTKNARDTQGLLTTGLAGNVDDLAGIRYGGKLDPETYYRVYGMFRKTQDFPLASGESAFDGWQSMRGGFRLDRFASESDTFTLEGEANEALIGEREDLPSFDPPYTRDSSGTHRRGGQHLLGRWNHTDSPGTRYSLQAYYDRAYYGANFQPSIYQHTLDVQFEDHFRLNQRNGVVWGASVRGVYDSIDNSTLVSWDPTSSTDYRVATFVQDDWEIVSQRLHLLLGSTFEYNRFSFFDVQPSARIVWTPNPRNTVWAAVSRAIHPPTRLDRDNTAVLTVMPTDEGLPAALTYIAEEDPKPEKLTAFELGYRFQPDDRAIVDVAGFYNRLSDQVSYQEGDPFVETTPALHAVIPLRTVNGFESDVLGVETSVSVKVTDNWRITASHSLAAVSMHSKSWSNDALDEVFFETESPRNQAQIHSHYSLTRNLSLDGAAYYVENLPAYDTPSYIRADLGVNWRPRETLCFSAGVQNLFDNQHPEYGRESFQRSSEVPRSFYLQMSWQY